MGTIHIAMAAATEKNRAASSSLCNKSFNIKTFSEAKIQNPKTAIVQIPFNQAINFFHGQTAEETLL